MGADGWDTPVIPLGRTASVRADAEEAVRAADRDPASGLTVAEHAARAAASARDATAISTAERAWGHALLHCGELDDAVRHLRRAVTWGERAGSPELAAHARLKLAFAVLQRGRPHAAMREVDVALGHLDGAVAARARAQRGIILHVIGRLDAALAEYGAALPVLRRGGDLLGVQRTLINRALVHTDRHAFARAEQDLLDAEDLARRLDRPLTIGLIANNLGLVASLRGDVPDALQQLDRAERIIGAHGAQLGTLHQDRAELLLSMGLVSEARMAAEAAVAAYGREGRDLKVPEVRLLLAQADVLAGDQEAAAGQARRALRRFRSQGRPEWAELARLAALRAQLAAGRSSRIAAPQVDTMVARLTAAGWPAAALEADLVAARLARHPADAAVHLDRAGARAGRGPAALRARAWYARAVRRQVAGDAAGVLRAARAGLRILGEHSTALGATDLRVHAAVHRAELAELGLRVAFATGRGAEVLEWAERGRASELLARPARPPADPVLADLLAELRSVTREPPAPPGAARAPAGRQAALERRVSERARQVRGDVATEEPVGAAALAAALGDRALVEYVSVDGVLHAVTMVGGRLRLTGLGPVPAVADVVERLPFALRRLASPGRQIERLALVEAARALLDAAAARVDALLLATLPETAGRPLVVVPTGPLHGLPWALLPSCRGRPVSVAPSATLWHRGACAAESPAGPAVVVAGPGLAAGDEEAERVARLHGVRPLTGPHARVDDVLAALPHARVAHLAAHGRLSGDNPQFSAIELADGPLFVHDLERLPRVPRTVVLAACDTGRHVVRTGDELLGLATAFLRRGAAELIAPVLPVPDVATVPVMLAVHERLVDGAEPAAALAAAQEALRDAGPAATAAACFVCIGSGVAPIRAPQPGGQAGRAVASQATT